MVPGHHFGWIVPPGCRFNSHHSRVVRNLGTLIVPVHKGEVPLSDWHTDILGAVYVWGVNIWQQKSTKIICFVLTWYIYLLHSWPSNLEIPCKQASQHTCSWSPLTLTFILQKFKVTSQIPSVRSIINLQISSEYHQVTMLSNFEYAQVGGVWTQN